MGFTVVYIIPVMVASFSEQAFHDCFIHVLWRLLIVQDQVIIIEDRCMF